MEVHHHVRSTDFGNHRGWKKFSHYIWEFLMLFLAVFCGFLAENLREHSVEKKRTRLYAEQFYQELKLDTASLNSFIKNSGAAYNYYDSMITLLKRGLPAENDWKELYYSSYSVDVWNTITFHHASFDQIKNSGSLRNFHNKQLVNAIQDYEGAKDYVESYQTGLVNYYDNRFTPFVQANFDKELLYYGNKSPDRSRFDSLWDKSSKPMVFFSGLKNAPTMYKNMLLTIRDFYVYSLSNFYADLLKKSNHLLELLRKEYKLE